MPWCASANSALRPSNCIKARRQSAFKFNAWRPSQILEGLPAIPDHDILFVRSPASGGDGAVTLLARAMRQSFRL